MAVFDPQPGTKILLDDEYVFLPHPVSPTIVFAQEGRKAVVYQLERNRQTYALKVFKPKFRGPAMLKTSESLSSLSFKGLEACSRRCFSRADYSHLINKYPEMEYAVLMPWISGSTWFDVVYQGTPLTQDACKLIARNTVGVLAELEKQGYAHCDLAGGNVIVNTLNGEVSLIDVEDMFGPGLTEPTAFPMGTDGYQHRDSRALPKGQWILSGDRFSAAVLLAEMLGWFSADIRNNSDEEHYFSTQEMQDPASQRYLLMLNTLSGLSQDVADYFERAWNSSTLEECPTMAEWATALEFPLVRRWIPISAPPPAAPYNFSWTEPIPVIPSPPQLFVPLELDFGTSTPPDSPKFFRRQSLTSLAWMPSYGANGYLVQESDNDTFSHPLEFYNGLQTECTIQPCDHPKYYRVCSYNDSGNSTWSDIIIVK